MYCLTPAIWWWLYRTHTGLALRATGENPEAVIAAGIAPRTTAVWGCHLWNLRNPSGELAVAPLVLVQAGTFAEGMSAGRGFIAIAIVVLGRWNPIGSAHLLLLSSVRRVRY